MSTTVSSAEFLTAFRTRHACCRALLELSAEQSAFIDSDDYAALVALLGQKQQVLDALLDAGRRPVDVWQAWPLQRDQLPAGDRTECERLLAETESLLKQLMDSEQSSTDLLTVRRRHTEQALCAVNEGGMAQAAYGATQSQTGWRRLDVDL